MKSDFERIYQYQPLWGKWHIDSPVGEGSFGKVFRISHEEYGQTYVSAVKIISIPTAAQFLKAKSVIGADSGTLRNYFHEMVESLINEVNILYSLCGNSNILGYHDHMVVEHQDKVGWDILIRMEYIQPLSKYLCENQLTMEDIITLGKDICTALDICLKHGIIHRDIKDENIFINDDGIFKLGDFGIATKLFPIDGLNVSMGGTPNFMAPEVYHGKKYDASVDIYSLGLVMYRLLNYGRLPHIPSYPNPVRHVDKEVALEKRMCGMHFPVPAQAGGNLAKVVMKACSYEAKDRYASPIKMQQELENILKKMTDTDKEKRVTIPDDNPPKAPEDIAVAGSPTQNMQMS